LIYHCHLAHKVASTQDLPNTSVHGNVVLHNFLVLLLNKEQIDLNLGDNWSLNISVDLLCYSCQSGRFIFIR